MSSTDLYGSSAPGRHHVHQLGSLSGIKVLSFGRHFGYDMVWLSVTMVFPLSVNTSFGGVQVLASLMLREAFPMTSSPCVTTARSSPTGSSPSSPFRGSSLGVRGTH